MRIPPVLAYHAIGPAPDGASGIERALFMDLDRFADQMEDLSRRRLRCLTLGEYAVALDSQAVPPKSVLLTFDDAYAHVADLVTPVLLCHGFKAAMFAPVGHLGGRNSWDAARFPSLARLEVATPGQIRALDLRAWEVASHGFWHVDLRATDPAIRRIELIEARERLSALLGEPILDLAYPHGLHDAAVRRDAERAGYRMAFTTGYEGRSSRFQLPRWPVRGDDSLEAFRVKSSAWSVPLSHTYGCAPRWAKRTAKAVLLAATARAIVH
jgi:peptidoglycan/xylan/chitin deacetylase (PgdA/CDA1 family)